MSDKAKDIYTGFKKILKSPSIGSSAGRRSSSGSFSLSGALASFSISNTNSTTGTEGHRTSSLSAKGYGDADLSAAAAAAADEMFNEGKSKKERRSSFSFSTWKEKHREKKNAKQAQKDAEKVAAYGATAATPRAGSSRAEVHGRSNSLAATSSTMQPPGLTRSLSHNGATSNPPPSLHQRRSISGRILEHEVTNFDNTRGGSGGSQKQMQSSQPPVKPSPPPSSTPTTRTRSSTAATVRESKLTRENSARTRAASTAARPSTSTSSSNSYSFTQRKQEKTRTADRASTMIVDDVATIVKPRPGASRTASSSWDSDSDEDNDAFEDSQPRTRGFSRRSVSMDFMEPQQSTHLISKIWRKLPIQARLYGRNSVDLDLEKDRTSISRSSATKQLRKGDNGDDEYRIPSSPLPDERNVFGDKHIRFNYKVAYTPAEGSYTALESYDDILVRVCQFESHDQRRTAVKVQEFLERSMSFLRGTTTKRGQKVSISNEEIRFWRRLVRHDWASEESIEPPLTGKDVSTGPSARSHSSSSVTEEETDDDDVAVAPDMAKIAKLCEVVNYCLNTGDSLFTAEDVEEMVTLELLVEEDGWI